MPCLLPQDNAKPHFRFITTAGHCSRRVLVLNWPACNADLSPIESIWCIMKTNKQKLLSSWNPISAKNGTIFHSGKYAAVLTFFKICCWINFKLSIYFLKTNNIWYVVFKYRFTWFHIVSQHFWSLFIYLGPGGFVFSPYFWRYVHTVYWLDCCIRCWFFVYWS